MGHYHIPQPPLPPLPLPSLPPLPPLPLLPLLVVPAAATAAIAARRCRCCQPVVVGRGGSRRPNTVHSAKQRVLLDATRIEGPNFFAPLGPPQADREISSARRRRRKFHITSLLRLMHLPLCTARKKRQLYFPLKR